jgi:PKD repeat protein
MKNEKNIQKGITAVLFAAIMIASALTVIPSVSAVTGYSFSYTITASGTKDVPDYEYAYSASLCYNCFGTDSWECPDQSGGWIAIAMTRLPYPGSDSDYGCGCPTGLYSSYPGIVGWHDDTTAYYCTYRKGTGTTSTEPWSATETGTASVSKTEGDKYILTSSLEAPNHDTTWVVVSDNSDYVITWMDGANLYARAINQQPIADANGPYGENEGSPITFDAGGSSDPDSDELQYRWDFNNDGTWDTEWSSSPTVSYTWSDDWSGTAKVKVNDGDFTDTATASVTVNNVAPTVDAGADQTVDEGATVSFFGSYTDSGTADTHTIDWDFGDGNTASGTLTPTHVYADNGVYTVTLTVTDDDGGMGTDTLTVMVNNVAPTVDAGADQTVDEGTTVNFAGSYTDPGSEDTYTIDWDFGDRNTESGTLTPTHVYADNGVYTVTLTVTDDDGGMGTDTLTVMVNNVAPTVDAGADQTVDEGTTVNFAGSYTDPGSEDTYTIDWDFGDGNTESGTLTPTHVYADNGVYTVTLTVTDDDGGMGTDTLTVMVNNFAPTATFSNDGPKDEGSAVTVSFSDQNDPGTLDTFTYSFDWDNDGTYDVVDQPGASAQYTWYDEGTGTYTVKGMIKDNDGGSTEYTTDVTVNNVAPTVGAITAPSEPIPVGDSISASADFTDPGSDDTHTAVWDWGDGTTTGETVSGYHVSGSHAYSTPGVYTINLTVTDNDGASASAIFQFVVVYDPKGGFVTGGGWIDSPETAYRADPSLTGKAHFGFISKYEKGATTPTGRTDFKFKAADLDFHSDTYDWLVIAGARAKYKGIGTINGIGNYGFMLSAVDGDLLGGDQADKFRIKIWKSDTKELVYDNQLDAPDVAYPTTDIGGGAIVVHKNNKKL